MKWSEIVQKYNIEKKINTYAFWNLYTLLRKDWQEVVYYNGKVSKWYKRVFDAREEYQRYMGYILDWEIKVFSKISDDKMHTTFIAEKMNWKIVIVRDFIEWPELDERPYYYSFSKNKSHIIYAVNSSKWNEIIYVDWKEVYKREKSKKIYDWIRVSNNGNYTIKDRNDEWKIILNTDGKITITNFNKLYLKWYWDTNSCLAIWYEYKNKDKGFFYSEWKTHFLKDDYSISFSAFPIIFNTDQLKNWDIYWVVKNNVEDEQLFYYKKFSQKISYYDFSWKQKIDIHSTANNKQFYFVLSEISSNKQLLVYNMEGYKYNNENKESVIKILNYKNEIEKMTSWKKYLVKLDLKLENFTKKQLISVYSKLVNINFAESRYSKYSNIFNYLRESIKLKILNPEIIWNKKK